MSRIIQRNATCAWSPFSLTLIVGSITGAIDISFSTPTLLELYDLTSNDPKLVNSLELEDSYKFCRLVWSPFTDGHNMNSKEGIIIGALDDGSIIFFSASKFFESTLRIEDIIFKKKIHNGSVSALAVNPIQTFLIASGSSDGQVFRKIKVTLIRFLFGI